MTMTRFAIYVAATGALVGTAVTNNGAHPKDEGAKWDAAWAIVAVPLQIDDAVMTWSPTAKAFAEDPAKVEALLIPQVKAKNAAFVAAAYTTAFGKQKKYSRKQQEVLDFRDLSGALGVVVPNALTAALSSFLPGFAALNAGQQKKKFRFAMAEAALRGVSIDVVIGEYETAIDTTEAKVANWEAVEQVAVRAIKAATTSAAKRAAFAAINWNWTAS